MRLSQYTSVHSQKFLLKIVNFFHNCFNFSKEKKTILNGAAINRADLDEVTHNCPLSYFCIAAGTFICDILCLSMGMGLLFNLSTYELWLSSPEGFIKSSSSDLCFMNRIILFVCLCRRLTEHKRNTDYFQRHFYGFWLYTE